METIEFSVIVPTFDRPGSLSDAIESVLCQSLQPLEIIVVDNGWQSVERAMLPDSPYIRLVRAMPGVGVSQARNIGSILAKGTHLAFLDDDDAWEPNYLEEIANVYRERGADVVLGARKRMNAGTVVEAKSIPVNDQQQFMRLLLVGNPGATGSCITVRRDRFFRTSGFDPYLTTGQDRGLVLDMAIVGSKIERANSAFMLFRDDQENRARQNEPKKLAAGRRRYLKKYWHLYDGRQRITLIRQYIKLRITGRL